MECISAAREVNFKHSVKHLIPRAFPPGPCASFGPVRKDTRFLIVGGGIVGLAVGHKLLRDIPGARVTLLEKEREVAQHQSTHNSGVLHAGLSYRPGSLKARLAVGGIREMREFAVEHDIRHEICGKLVVAADEGELPRLHALHERGQANGLDGLKLLGRDEMREIEPHAGGVGALHVPEEGIIDYAGVCSTLAGLIREAGGEVRTQAPVSRMHRDVARWRVEAGDAEFTGDFLINCAGLHCDRVARAAGQKPSTRIIPFRGEYYVLKPEARHLCRHLIYPVPDPTFPFLGVHFTRMISGGVECGPNAVLACAREGYRWTDVNLPDLAESLTFPGLWKFLKKHPALWTSEVRSSLSGDAFCALLQRLVPEIGPSQIERGISGVRAQAMTPDGTLVQDFDLLESPGQLHVLNAPSPAATASLAIAGHIVERIARLTAAG